MKNACVCVLAAVVWCAAVRAEAAAGDIVLYASDVTTLQGNWSRIASTSSPGGQALSTADAGWSNTSAPLAAPADYVEAAFSAPAATAYHVWLRLRATSDSKWNDSVFVQFDDALDSSGAAIYRIGSTGGLTVNLENCSGCGVAGWGWQDKGYWLSQPAVVRFAASGTHRIRIQTREDGVQVDQIVLSPSTFLAGAPGPVEHDATIVPKPSVPAPPAASTPYSGSAAAIPGTIQAANFDNGGEGVAYRDTTSGNSGGVYRQTDVDLQASSDGGYNIGWAAAGEWLNYSVNVAGAGSYTAQLRVASPGGGAIHLGFNTSSSVWASVAIPATGGWQNWTTVSVPVTLGAGAQLMTVLFDTAGVNFASVTVAASGTPPPVTPPPSSGGATVTVPAGGNLQLAIDTAQAGDTILLTPGATYSGSFVLPVKSGSGWITIRSAAADSQLPADGVRITPQYAALLPKVQGGAAGAPAFVTAAGAHHYRLQLLEIVSTYVENNIIELGDGNPTQHAMSQVPHDLVVDRCYIHGDAWRGQKRGIALNSASTSIVNSYISDIKSPNEDTQAIMAWNGPGPYTIENDYLEAAGENVLFGGGDPSIAGLVPSDISFRFNHVTKQTAWRGQSWVIKNLVEFKNAQRVTVDGNVIEYSWAAAQPGYAIVITPRNQDGTAPWVVTQGIHITNNTIRHVAAGINILATDTASSIVTNDVLVRNNLFVDVSAARWGGTGWCLLTQGGRNIVFDHNTVFTDGTSVVYADGPAVSAFVFTNNIIPDNSWAVMGGGASEGVGTLSKYFPGATFLRNVIIGGNASAYPANNFFPATDAAVGFVDLAGGNYALTSSSAYHGAGTDGADIGVVRQP